MPYDRRLFRGMKRFFAFILLHCWHAFAVFCVETQVTWNTNSTGVNQNKRVWNFYHRCLLVLTVLVLTSKLSDVTRHEKLSRSFSEGCPRTVLMTATHNGGLTRIKKDLKLTFDCLDNELSHGWDISEIWNFKQVQSFAVKRYYKHIKCFIAGVMSWWYLKNCVSL